LLPNAILKFQLWLEPNPGAPDLRNWHTDFEL
jgi:hypothetical protein